MKKIGVIVNCDGEGGWTKVAYINMTQSGATCPTGLIQTSFANINHAVCAYRPLGVWMSGNAAEVE